MSEAQNAADILAEASSIVTGSRQQEHGPPERCFGMIADLWSVYLATDISPAQVAWMMVLLKVAREDAGSGKVDNSIDAAGYAALAGELADYVGEVF